MVNSLFCFNHIIGWNVGFVNRRNDAMKQKPHLAYSKYYARWAHLYKWYWHTAMANLVDLTLFRHSFTGVAFRLIHRAKPRAKLRLNTLSHVEVTRSAVRTLLLRRVEWLNCCQFEGSAARGSDKAKAFLVYTILERLHHIPVDYDDKL